MKQEIHPQYFDSAVVTCACGNTFVTGSTRESLRVEICSNCHPYYTGQAKFVDTEGRVEAFKRRETQKVAPRAKKVEEKKDSRPRTLKEMLQMEG
jgi:large subunit ribosomal protein L31